MSNTLVFAGRLGRDAELKTVGQNDLLEFTVANDVGWSDKKTTNWFRCAVWGKRATSLEQYMKKGQQVVVHGELTLREYTNKDGVAKTSAEVRVEKLDLVGGKDEGGSAPAPAPAQSKPPVAKQAEHDADSEDMPF